MLLSYFENERREKISKLGQLNGYAIKGQTLFTGSSLMEHFPVNEFILDSGLHKIVYNRGIGGFTTKDMMGNIDVMIFDLEPSEIFINIGSNDINDETYKVENLIDNYRYIIGEIKKRLPSTKINIIAFYPVNGEEDFGVPFIKNLLQFRTNEKINQANQALEDFSRNEGVKFINLNEGLNDEKGNLKKEYTLEGIHINPTGYKIIFDGLLPHLL